MHLDTTPRPGDRTPINRTSVPREQECLAGHYLSFTLPNGLEVHALHNPGVESVRAEVTFRVGSRFDPPGKEGLAHFAEHLLLCAAEGFPTAKALDLATLEHGVSMDCYTEGDFMKVYSLGPSSEAKFIIEQTKARAFGASFLDNEVEFERDRILQEIVLYTREPEARFHRLEMPGLTFPGQGLMDALGTRATVSAITAGDLREFSRREYVPNRACLSVCGNLPTDFEEMIHRSFGSVSPRPLTPGPAPLRSRWDTGNGSGTLVRAFPEYYGHSVEVGFPANTAMSDERFAMGILNILLQREGPASLLGHRLQRELGVTYSIGLDRFRSFETGVNGIGFTTDSTARAKLGIDAMREILSNLGSHPEFAERFNHALTMRVADLRATRDDPIQFSHSISYDWTYGGAVMLPDEEIDRVLAVTPEQVLELAAKYYDWNRRFLVVTGAQPEGDIDFEAL